METLIDILKENIFHKAEMEMILPNAVESMNINEEWKRILSNVDVKMRVNLTIMYWEQYAPTFQPIIDLFKSNLTSIDTIVYNEKVCVIYTVQLEHQQESQVVHYIGYVVKQPEKDSVLKHLPKELQMFYSHVHNGFVLCELDELGLMPEDQFYCEGFDWNQEDFIEGLSVNDSYMIYMFGDGDGVLFDVSKTPATSVICYHDNVVERVVTDAPVQAICECMLEQLEI